MVKVAGEPNVNMITVLVNKIFVEGVIPAEWELSLNVNCSKGRSDSWESQKCRGLKLTDPILKRARELMRGQ